MKTWIAVIILGLCVAGPLAIYNLTTSKAADNSKIGVVDAGLLLNHYSRRAELSDEKRDELWKRLNPHIEAYAKAKGFRVLISYNDSRYPVGEYSPMFPDPSRKTPWMSLGYIETTPPKIQGSIDITRALIGSLDESVLLATQEKSPAK